MVRVQDIMLASPDVAGIDESVHRAAHRMEHLHLDCLPVLNEDGHLVGLLTSWDVWKTHPNRLVADAMSSRFVSVSPDASIWEAHSRAVEEASEHLMVVEGRRLVGLITRSQLEVAVARLTDALTGLPTASYLRYKVEMLWQPDRDLSLIFIDINDFGSLNKRLGHAVGDQALQVVSRALARRIDPEQDALCRYGGDEFAIVTNRQGTEAQTFARSLVAEIAGATHEHGVDVRISVGVAGGRRRSPRQRDSAMVDNLINLASRASTEAKQIESGVLVMEFITTDCKSVR